MYNQTIGGLGADIKTGSEIRDRILKAQSKTYETNNYESLRQDLWRLEQRFGTALEILVEEIEALKGKLFVPDKK